MKKLFALVLLGLATLGLAAGRASAWHCFTHLPCHGHCHCCCGYKICCSQYNAFSPFCCDGACGGPMPGQANPWLAGGPQACSPGEPQACFTGDGCCLGELPAPGALNGGTQMGAPIPTPGSPMPTYNGTIRSPGIPVTTPGPTTQLVPTPMPSTGMTSMAVPSYGPGMMGAPMPSGR